MVAGNRIRLQHNLSYVQVLPYCVRHSSDVKTTFHGFIEFVNVIATCGNVLCVFKRLPAFMMECNWVTQNLRLFLLVQNGIEENTSV